MKKNILLALLALTLFACRQKTAKTDEKPQAIDPAILVSCTGIGQIKLTDSYETLENKVGPQNVSIHENNVHGKFVTIWQDSPRQLNIYFEEQSAPFVHIKHIETFDPQAPYMTADSIKVGMTARDIVKRNSDMPVSVINPYTLEDGGLIKSFNNGSIAATTPCLGGHMDIMETKNVHVRELEEFRKEKIIKTSHRLMLAERMELVLSNFRISN